ncbi:STAS domain-containing protein [Nocardioides albertanoniae]|uniref:STAS domain-containing protein n=1 Tax=Nocardioides albertanoniae TaxID=1175486 RepID=UPI001152DC2E|nr:STAS domain-containing protein [Nocardioides albertanoniae]
MPLSDGTGREALHDLRWRIDEMLADSPRAVVVEVSGLTRLSSATIAALLWAKRRCTTRGVGLLLTDPDNALAGQLHRAGLHTVWDIQAGATPPLKGPRA